jgi:hypothetical protein
MTASPIYEIKDHEVKIADVTISYDAFTPTAWMDFPQKAWAEPNYLQMITDFAAGGHHPRISGPLVRRSTPCTRFLSVDAYVCSTLP